MCLSLRGGLRHQVCAHDGVVSLFLPGCSWCMLVIRHAAGAVLATHFPWYCPNVGRTRRRPKQWDIGAAQGLQGQEKGLSSLSVAMVGG